MLTALSRGAGGGVGTALRAAIFGRFAGGAGGAGLALAAAAAPLVAGAGVDLGAAGGGGEAGFGVGATCSSRYASGVQPCAEVVMFIHSHQPITR